MPEGSPRISLLGNLTDSPTRDGEDGTKPSGDARDLYNLRPVQQILNLFLDGEIKELDPVFDLHYTATYPVVEATTGLAPREVPGLLDRMAIYGLLEAQLVERAIACDSCDSVNVGTKLVCPSCKSTNFYQRRTMEHLSCGYIDFESVFRTLGRMSSCPKCGTELRPEGPDIRVRDGWFVCGDCQKRTHDPLLMFVCRSCDRIMSIKDVGSSNVYSFTLSKEADLNSVFRTEPIKDILTSLGYQVESPGFVDGKATKHRFDILGTIGDSMIAVNVVYSNVIVNEFPVISMFGSKYDSGLKNCILVAAPGATDSARRLASQYGIKLIEGTSVAPVVEKIKQASIAWTTAK
jgi:hypothetical protein